MKSSFSFRHKLLIAFLIVSTIPLIVVSVLVIKESGNKLEKKIIETNLDFIQQASANTGRILSQTNDLALFIFQNKDVYSFLHLPDDTENEESDRYILKIYKTLMFFIQGETGITSVYIEGGNGLSFSINPLNQKLNILSGEDRRALIEKDGDVIWKAASPDTIAQSRIIKDYYDLDNILGQLTIQLSSKQILKGLTKDNDKQDYSFCVINSDDKVLLSSGNVTDRIMNSLLPEIRSSGFTSGYYRQEEKKSTYLSFYSIVPSSGMIIISSMLSVKPGLADFVLNRVMIVSAVMILVSIIMAIMFSRMFFTPLKTLEGAMEKLENENFSTRIPKDNNYEIDSLIQSFNNMARRLDQLHNEVYVARVREKEAELIALETQINPHFLYNTLDTIYWMTKLEGSHESAGMIKTLSELFRISLSSGKEKIPLRKEIEHLNYYMEIQTRRFRENFSYELNIGEIPEDRSVLKLILQPLIENAIAHGIEKKEDSSFIHVSVGLDEQGILIYEIEDDGAGFDTADLYNKGFGLKNVDERLRLEYGPDYGLQVASHIGKGTRITVRQPKNGIKDERCNC